MEQNLATSHPKISYAINAKKLVSKKFKVMDFEGSWKESFGSPAPSGTWIIWGNSANGKTHFCLQLAKYLTQFEKVLYNSLEEGYCLSFQVANEHMKMDECGNRYQILDQESMEDLYVRLRRRSSPRIVIIDSFQYADLSKKEYIKLKQSFPNKLFIFISHADGKLPEGRPAKFVRFDAMVKIRIEGFKAFPASRFGGGKPFVIWEKGAKDYWGNVE